MCYIHNSKHVEHFKMGIKCVECGRGLYIMCVGEDEWMKKKCRICYPPESIKTKCSETFSFDKIKTINIIKPISYIKDEGVLVYDEQKNQTYITNERTHLISFLQQQSTQDDALNIQEHFQYILQGIGPFDSVIENKITGHCLVGVTAIPFGLIICDEVINESFEKELWNKYHPLICTQNQQMLNEYKKNFERSNGALKLHTCGYDKQRAKFVKSDLPKDYLPQYEEQIITKIAEFYTREVTGLFVNYDQRSYIVYPGTNWRQRKKEYGSDWNRKNADKYGIAWHTDSNSAEACIAILNIAEDCAIQYGHKLGYGCKEIRKKRRSLHIQYGMASRCVKHRPVTASTDHMSMIFRTFTKKYKHENNIL